MEKGSISRRIITAVIILIAVLYVIYVIGRASFNPIKTESANIITVSDSISGTGCFIRTEEYLSYTGSGVISYIKSDGDKIFAGEDVADIYQDTEQAAATKRVARINKQLEQLQQLGKSDDILAETPNEIDSRVDHYLADINLCMTKGDFSKSGEDIDNLLFGINQRQLSVGKMTDFNAKIASLEQEKKELEKKVGNTGQLKHVSSASSGYFVSFTDGYENQLTIEDLKNLKKEDLAKDSLTKKNVPETVIGKIIKGVYWYVACPVSAEDALRIQKADSLGIDIPTANDSVINVELYAVNQKDKTSDAVVILRGNYMNSDMVSLRRDHIEIVLNTYTGIYVPKNAVHQMEITQTVTDKNGKEIQETKNIQGVYVKVANEISFRQIVPLFTGNDYVICKSNPKNDELVNEDKIKALKVYDDMIIEGANLYDGKILSKTN